MDIHDDNSHEDEMMNFYIFILFADEFICSKCLLGKSKVKIAFHKCQEHQEHTLIIRTKTR